MHLIISLRANNIFVPFWQEVEVHRNTMDTAMHSARDGQHNSRIQTSSAPEIMASESSLKHTLDTITHEPQRKKAKVLPEAHPADNAEMADADEKTNDDDDKKLAIGTDRTKALDPVSHILVNEDGSSDEEGTIASPAYRVTSLDALEHRVDTLLEWMAQGVESVKMEIERMKKRVERLEQWQRVCMADQRARGELVAKEGYDRFIRAALGEHWLASSTSRRDSLRG